MAVITNNFRMKLIALILAIALVSYVYTYVSYQYPDAVRARLVVQNVDARLMVSSRLSDYVDLKVRGPLQKISALREAAIVCILDLKGIKSPGTYRVPLQVPNLGDVVVIEKPEYFDVDLAARSSKELTVSLSKSGRPPEGFVAGEADVSPLKVIVDGPSDQIARVSVAVAEVDLGGETRTVNRLVAVKLYDDNYKMITSELVHVRPSRVRVNLPIRSTANLATLRVEPQIVGALPQGYILGPVTADPSVVYLPQSSGAALEGATVRTKPVDVSGRTASFTADDVLIDYTAPVPSALPKSARIHVTVVEVAKNSATTYNLPVTIVNQSAELGYSAPAVVSLASEDLPSLSDAEKKALRAEIDVRGLGPGEYRITPLVIAPGSLGSYRLYPDTLAVKVAKK
jgi:YbbR domain-containing protein